MLDVGRRRHLVNQVRQEGRPAHLVEQFLVRQTLGQRHQVHRLQRILHRRHLAVDHLVGCVVEMMLVEPASNLRPGLVRAQEHGAKNRNLGFLAVG